MPYYSELGLTSTPSSAYSSLLFSTPYSNHSSIIASNFQPYTTSVSRHYRGGFKPHLSTISELNSPLKRINPPAYHSPLRPLIKTINTADIDVSRNRYRKFEKYERPKIEKLENKEKTPEKKAPVPKLESPRESVEEREAKPNTNIRRDRTTVRIQTIHKDTLEKEIGAIKSWRDNFKPDELGDGEAKRRKKTQGEILKEKFLIRSKSKENILKPDAQPRRKHSVRKSPSFHDICKAITSDSVVDELNPGQPEKIKRRQSRQLSTDTIIKEIRRTSTQLSEEDLQILDVILKQQEEMNAEEVPTEEFESRGNVKKKKISRKKSDVTNEAIQIAKSQSKEKISDPETKSPVQRRRPQKKIERTLTNGTHNPDLDHLVKDVYKSTVKDISNVDIEQTKFKPKPIITGSVGDIEECKSPLKAIIVDDIEVEESPKRNEKKFKFNVIVEVDNENEIIEKQKIKPKITAPKLVLDEDQKRKVLIPNTEKVVVTNMPVKRNVIEKGKILKMKDTPVKKPVVEKMLIEMKEVKVEAPKSPQILFQNNKKQTATISTIETEEIKKEKEITTKEILEKKLVRSISEPQKITVKNENSKPTAAASTISDAKIVKEDEFRDEIVTKAIPGMIKKECEEENTVEVKRNDHNNKLLSKEDNHSAPNLIKNKTEITTVSKQSNKSAPELCKKLSQPETTNDVPAAVPKIDGEIKPKSLKSKLDLEKPKSDISSAPELSKKVSQPETTNDVSAAVPKIDGETKPKSLKSKLDLEKPKSDTSSKTDVKETNKCDEDVKMTQEEKPTAQIKEKTNDPTVQEKPQLEETVLIKEESLITGNKPEDIIEKYTIDEKPTIGDKPNCVGDDFARAKNSKTTVVPLKDESEPSDFETKKKIISKRSLVRVANKDDPDLEVFIPPEPEPEPEPEPQSEKDTFVPLQSNRLSNWMHPWKKPEQFDVCPVEIFARPKVIRGRHYPRPRGHPAVVPEPKEESSSEEDDDSEDTSSEDETSSEEECDSGFGSKDKDCDVNIHKKCEKLTANLCGVNQKLVVEAIESVRKGSQESRDSPTTNHANNPAFAPDSGDLPEEYSQSSTFTGFQRSGRITPPATTIPRFRKYCLDDFNFLKVLGKGSFGKVLLAELKGTEYYYAVKCLKKDVVLEDDDVECTLIERKVLALGTKHPYLCHLLCTFQTESHLFFVMEYLNGGDLMFHIQASGKFPEHQARFYGAEIVSGLKFLHNKGIVYRDLKLDNVLLDFDGHVRIADFGMCKLQIFLDRMAETFCGTPDYMAPEIIRGQHYNQNVDWWSFGVLLYEMLLGQSPFSGCDEDELFWSICNEKPVLPRFLSTEATNILTLLLEKDASKRLGNRFCPHGDIQDHAFFKPIDWPALEARQLEAPFKPHLQHPLDTQYFDKHFTVEKAKLTPVDSTILQSIDQTQFQGFSYTNPNATDK